MLTRGSQLPTIIPERSGFRIGIKSETGKRSKIRIGRSGEAFLYHRWNRWERHLPIATIVTRFMKAYPEECDCYCGS
ncbi:hypothetical protein AAGT10_14805 (plasmid) [Sulfolobus tengchongensis]